MKTKYIVRSIAIQPTTFCNLDCSYCYLPFREKTKKMSPLVTSNLATLIGELAEDQVRSPIIITLHAGEPLAIGKKNFEAILQPLEQLRKDGKVEYSLQTNATLIDNDWCEIFDKYKLHVGVSIDGPLLNNASFRKYRNNRIAQDNILKGIHQLKNASIPFIALAVVDEEMLDYAKEFHTFFQNLGCWELGINFKERIGTNLEGIQAGDEKVKMFWKQIFELWKNHPQMSIREIKDTVPRMLTQASESETFDDDVRDIFPCIKWNGDIALLSPELLDPSKEDSEKFVIGNVSNTSIKEILLNPEAISYVQDFSVGVAACRESCDYFSFCKGGMAANKFCEHGSMTTTLTTFCRHSVIDVVEAILTSIQK